MRTLPARLGALLVALGACACTSGTETGNPPTEHTVTIMALSRETTEQALVLDEGWLSLHRLAIVPCAAATSPLKASGAFLIGWSSIRRRVRGS